MNLVCLVIDRLQAGYLGAYGNCWIETPELDRLAAESFTCDHACIAAPELASLYHALWLRQHPLARRHHAVDGPSLARLCSQAGLRTMLVSDDPAVHQHPAAADFDELVSVAIPPAGDSVELDQTHTAQYLAQACEALGTVAQGADGHLVWLHTAALGGRWDAPQEFVERYLDADDEELVRFAEAPAQILAKDYDPDDRLAIRRAYAAQVTLLDTCLGPLLEIVRAAPQPTALVLLGARGFPLGEHCAVGPASDALYAELIHIPLLLRLPDRGALSRNQALIQPPDVPATLLALAGVQPPPLPGVGQSLLALVDGEMANWRDRVVLVNAAGERAVRTPAWYLRVPLPHNIDALEPEPAELFCKPDDRWDQNEVADRCPEIVGKLEDVLEELEHRAGEDSASELTPLDLELLEGLG